MNDNQVSNQPPAPVAPDVSITSSAPASSSSMPSSTIPTPTEPIAPGTAVTPPMSQDPPAVAAPTMSTSFEPAGGGNAAKVIGLILLAIIVIAAMAAGGYYLGMNVNSGSPEPTPVQTIEPLATPTATPDPTADWKSYTNDKYYFSIKHPDTFTVLTEKEAGISGPNTGKPSLVTTLGDKTTISTGSDKPFDGFSIYTLDISSTTFDKYIEGEVAAVKKAASGVADAKAVDLKVGDLTFTTIQREEGIMDYYIATADGKTAVVLSNSIGSSESYPEMFKSILNTFEFTDVMMKESSSPTSSPKAQ